jgi:hypothetical protein
MLQYKIFIKIQYIPYSVLHAKYEKNLLKSDKINFKLKVCIFFLMCLSDYFIERREYFLKTNNLNSF